MNTLSLIRTVFFAAIFAWVINSPAFAQNTRKNDVIIQRDGLRIEAFIQEVDETTIRYKKLRDPEGPVYSVQKKNVASIIYGNGEVENFAAVPDLYFEENHPAAPVERYVAPSRPLFGAPDSYNGMDSPTLRSKYSFFLKKASVYRKMSIIGASGGALLVIVGVVVRQSAGFAHQGTAGYKSYSNKIEIGENLISGGVLAGLPFTVIGFVKKKSYLKKAGEVKNELARRGEPVSFGISPGYNPVNQSGYLTLRLKF